jgi:phosphatidylcholine synthase
VPRASNPRPSGSAPGALLAWLVHVYTASGAVLALLALRAFVDYRFRDGFFWLAVQVCVDATDGLLARAVDVSRRTPHFNGAKLDDIVDYLTYVFVPAFFVWRAQLVPEAWALPVTAAMLLSSGYGFNRDDAKTSDHFFTGFPSYWNISVFYLHLAGWGSAVNTLILLMFAVLVFVPVRYIYPSRTPKWRALTLGLGVLWGAEVVVLLWQMPSVSRSLFLASLFYPAYYVALSVHETTRRTRIA